MNTEHQPAGNQDLAPVYLDNKPITLKDAKPKVSAILSAMGKPETTDVKWLQFQPNTQGKPLRGEEVLDRTTDPTKPIYLTSTTKGSAAAGTQKGTSIGGFSPAVGTAFAGQGAKQAAGKGQADWSEDKPAADDAGMQDDAEVGGESGRTATTDE